MDVCQLQLQSTALPTELSRVWQLLMDAEAPDPTHPVSLDLTFEYQLSKSQYSLTYRGRSSDGRALA